MDSRKYFILTTAIVAIATGSWLSWQVLQTPEFPRTATLLPAPAELAEFTLRDQRGNAFSRESFKGQWSLVFFGFTHCPDICPLTLQVLGSIVPELIELGAEIYPRHGRPRRFRPVTGTEADYERLGLI
jgi:protein SCO1/2